MPLEEVVYHRTLGLLIQPKKQKDCLNLQIQAKNCEAAATADLDGKDEDVNALDFVCPLRERTLDCLSCV